VTENGNPAARPVIGITTSSTEISIEGELLHIRYAPTVYTDAVLRAGGLPVHLPIAPSAEADELLALVDGIILSGGGDISPAAYGAPAEDGLVDVEPARDLAEQDLLRCAAECHTPVLGICRGLQLMNVAFGGTLRQDLRHETVTDHHPKHVPDTVPAHPVIIEPGSLLATAVAAEQIDVNSTHHQAVDVVGRPLRVTARSFDGVVEALELAEPDFWMVGVQWHPEAMEARHQAQRRLFRALIEASLAKRSANRRQRPGTFR